MSDLIKICILEGKKSPWIYTLYKPYRDVFSELFKPMSNIFNFNEIPFYSNDKDNTYLQVVDYKELKEEFQNIFCKDKKLFRDIIKTKISLLKASNKAYTSFYLERQKAVEIYLYRVNNLNTVDNLLDNPWQYVALFTKDKFKRFIVYLMKNYKIDAKKGFTLFKSGLENNMFQFSLDTIKDDIIENLLRIYKDNGETINSMQNRLFNDFLSVDAGCNS